MKKNYLLLTLILFLLQNCGYSPIYSKTNSESLNFNIIEITGDEEMNKMIIRKIERSSKNSKKKNLDLNINTFYKKNILTKNKEGKATSYSLTKKIEFKIINSKNPQTYEFLQKTKTSTMVSEFELEKYEKTIKYNFINLKIEELINKLSDLK